MIRDVAGSYRRAIVETVHHYSGWRPDPAQIDELKSEGCWNNDWEASLELLRRRALATGAAEAAGAAGAAAAAGAIGAIGAAAAGPPGGASVGLPPLAELVTVFGGFYFGGDPEGDPAAWRGFIGAEPLLVTSPFFEALSAAGIAWGFVSGAEPPSVRYVLEQRLGLLDPPFLAMGQAPDKPDPTGLLQLAAALLQRGGSALGAGAPPVAYLGDTVADVETVQRARRERPDQRFWSLAVAPPHLQGGEQQARRVRYEQRLQQAGADRILPRTTAVLDTLAALLAA